jgi:hypothetical protein
MCGPTIDIDSDIDDNDDNDCTDVNDNRLNGCNVHDICLYVNIIIIILIIHDDTVKRSVE